MVDLSVINHHYNPEIQDALLSRIEVNLDYFEEY